jgi:hypothetical protein
MRRSVACPGPSSAIDRRGFLRGTGVGLGAAGLGGLGMGDILRLRAQAANAANPQPDTAVIFVWLPGGPPHMEMYDMKPEAPADYRGDFRPISTTVPGLDVCELMPLHAQTAGRFNIIRSVAHEFADHGGGHKRFLTGRDPRSPVGFVNDYPMVGSVVAKMRESRGVGVPNYIVGADDGRTGVDVFSFGSAYLGSTYHPFTFGGDPNNPKWQIRNLESDPRLAARIDDRSQLLAGLDNLRRDVDRGGLMDSMDEFNRQAVELLTSDRARKAFDLSQEPDALRDRYGRHPWGQRAILARRLVEAGASWVTMVMENPIAPGQSAPPDLVYNWDSHAVNCHIFTDARVRLPIYDQAITALVDDLIDRGLDRRVLLVVTGEFGRTPRISQALGRPGRDHWPSAMSMLVSGGGMRTGQVIGSTNSKGEHPKDRPLTPNDLWATVYRHLGIDIEHSFPDHSGRPMPILPYGQPIAELLPS